MTVSLTRRRLLELGAAVGGAFALGGLAGCSRPGDDQLRFFNWQDYIDPALIADFERVTGLSVTYTTYESNDDLADRLALAGVPRRGSRKPTSFDLVVPSDSLFTRLRDQDRLQPFDTDVVTEALLGSLAPEFRTMASDPGNRFSVPWATGTTGIGYDTTVFPEPPTWDVFLDATYAGRATLLDEKREAFAAAMFSLGIDPNSRQSADVDAAAAQLERMLGVAALNSATYLDDLAGGRLDVAQAFSTDVLQARRTNPNLAFVIPDAGGTRWIDLLCIPDDATNPDAANQFVAFFLDPKVAAANAAAVFVDTGNAAAQEFLPAEVRDDPVIYPPADVAARLVFLDDLGDDEARYNDAWERLRG
jgi:spermidine/putrescine-binding protein